MPSLNLCKSLRNVSKTNILISQVLLLRCLCVQFSHSCSQTVRCFRYEEIVKVSDDVIHALGRASDSLKNPIKSQCGPIQTPADCIQTLYVSIPVPVAVFDPVCVFARVISAPSCLAVACSCFPATGPTPFLYGDSSSHSLPRLIASAASSNKFSPQIFLAC